MKLYNNVSYNKSDMDHLRKCVNASIDISDKHIISFHCVILPMLFYTGRRENIDGHEGLCSDNISNAPHSLFVILN